MATATEEAVKSPLKDATATATDKRLTDECLDWIERERVVSFARLHQWANAAGLPDVDGTLELQDARWPGVICWAGFGEGFADLIEGLHCSGRMTQYALDWQEGAALYGDSGNRCAALPLAHRPPHAHGYPEPHFRPVALSVTPGIK